MPPLPQQPIKRHGIWAIVGYVALVLAAVFVVKTIFRQLWPSKYALTTSRGSSTQVMPYATRGAMPESAKMGIMAPEITEDMAIMMPPVIPAPGGGTPVDDRGIAIKPRVIKTGNLSLRIVEINRAIDDVRGVVSGKDGFVESSSIYDSGEGPRSGYVTVRVPADKFDPTMTALKSLAQVVLNESVNGQDVTMEFVDLEAQLRNAKAEEQSYLEILKRASRIEDVLAVTQQLSRVRGQIEQLEGRKRYLSNKTDYATITVNLTEQTSVQVPSRNWRPLEVIRQTLREVVIAFQGLVDLFIRVIIGLVGLVLPIAAATALIIWVGWKIVKAMIRKMNK